MYAVYMGNYYPIQSMSVEPLFMGNVSQAWQISWIKNVTSYTFPNAFIHAYLISFTSDFSANHFKPACQTLPRTLLRCDHLWLCKGELCPTVHRCGATAVSANVALPDPQYLVTSQPYHEGTLPVSCFKY